MGLCQFCIFCASFIVGPVLLNQHSIQWRNEVNSNIIYRIVEELLRAQGNTAPTLNFSDIKSNFLKHRHIYNYCLIHIIQNMREYPWSDSASNIACKDPVGVYSKQTESYNYSTKDHVIIKSSTKIICTTVQVLDVIIIIIIRHQLRLDRPVTVLVSSKLFQVVFAHLVYNSPLFLASSSVNFCYMPYQIWFLCS
jgi:hypothetical protein